MKKRFTLKSKKWFHYYFDNSSSTYRNATQSAIKAYGYDPVRQYNLASVVGHKNLTKYKVLIKEEAEKVGLTLPVLLNRLYEAANNEGYYKIKDLIILLGYAK